MKSEKESATEMNAVEQYLSKFCLVFAKINLNSVCILLNFEVGPALLGNRVMF